MSPEPLIDNYSNAKWMRLMNRFEKLWYTTETEALISTDDEDEWYVIDTNGDCTDAILKPVEPHYAISWFEARLLNEKQD